MRYIFLNTLFLLFITVMNAQVGIGTIDPQAILHIKASDSINPAKTDGILLPRITKFPAIDPNGNHHGLLVHLTDTTTYATQTKPPGFYYWHFPSRKWINIHTAITNILGSYWSINGNSDTDVSTNFIGTTDDKSLNFRVNNITAGTIQNDSPNSTAFGYNTLANNPTGVSNSAFGYAALSSNTTGYENTAIGHSALTSNTTSRRNTAVGSQALKSNTTGTGNVAVGSRTLSDLSSGGYNTAIGEAALNSMTNGEDNTALGSGAMFVSNGTTTMKNNVAVGARSLYQVQGSDNVGVGKSTLSLLLKGEQNVAVGSDVLSSTQTGSGNVGVGHHALYFNYSGNNNTAIGYLAMSGNTSGNNNTAIGHKAGPDDVKYSNTTAIGNEATVSYSNTVRIGNASVISIGGQVGWTSLSDARVKDNVKEDVPGIDFIKELRPVTYNLNSNKQNAISNPSSYVAKSEKNEIEKIRQTGFIAQEVEASAKKLGYDFSGVSVAKSENDLYSLSYSTFVVPLVKAVQEQQELIDNLLKQNQELEKRLLKLENISK